MKTTGFTRLFWISILGISVAEGLCIWTCYKDIFHTNRGMIWWVLDLICCQVKLFWWPIITKLHTLSLSLSLSHTHTHTHIHIHIIPGGSAITENTLQCKRPVCYVGGLSLIPGSGGSLQKEMANHSSILAWEMPWTEEPGRRQSIGSH